MRFRRPLLPTDRPRFEVVGPKVLRYLRNHEGEPIRQQLIARAICESEMSVFLALRRLELEERIVMDRYPKKDGYRRITVIDT